MPVLMDFSQVILATLFTNIGNHTNTELSEDLVRHMFLNSLRSNRKKFLDEYGELVICCDGKGSWRREVFPYYKSARRKAREDSELNWTELFQIISTIREELQENFPYKVLHFDGCEADDIIGTICHEYGTELLVSPEKFLILSGDKDYVQLQTYANVDQYDPVKKKFIRNDKPEQFLNEHILKGDVSDGVPNILSADNCLVVGERQKPMTAKRMTEYLASLDNLPDDLKIKFYRNKMLIDLSQTPEKYKQRILEEFRAEKQVGRKKLFDFFVQKKLKNLLTDIQDF
jgi:5'-3' exonuclease